MKRKWLITSLLLLSSCCVSLPKEEQIENLLPAPSLDESLDTSLATPFFTIGNWPDRNWWEMFGSCELNELIAIGLVQNPTILKSQARIEAAWQNAKVARSRLYPYLFFKADDSWEHLSKNGLYRALNPQIPINANLVDLEFELNYDFDFWGKHCHIFQAALGEERAREIETIEAEIVIAAALSQAYFALKTNVRKREVYNQLVNTRQAILDLQQLLAKNALLSTLPPLQANENLLEAQKKLEVINAEISINQHQINILMGQGPDELLTLCEPLNNLTEQIALPCNLSLGLLGRRPDLMAQIWRADALAHEVGAAMADFYPDINIEAFIGLETVTLSKLFNLSSVTFGVEPALNLPIFTAGAIRANVRSKKAQFDEAIFEYNRLLLQSAQEVADLLAQARAIFNQKQQQEMIIEKAQDRYDLTLLRRQKGLDNLFANYALYDDLLQKELANLDLLYNQYLSVIRLVKALGGGYLSECYGEIDG